MRLPDYDAVGDGRLARPYVRSLTSAARASVTVWNAPAEDASDGGDWCEAVPLSEHELALSIGDVAGHGEAVAATKRRLRASVLEALRGSSAPADVLGRANDEAWAAGEGTIVTAIVAVYDNRLRTLRLSNAGHPPPLLVARGREAFVSQRNNGLPLGIFSHYRATELIVELPPEAIVVFYTDGVTERKRDLIEGEAELVAASRVASELTSVDVAGAIAETLFERRCGRDDSAIMVLRVPPPTIGRDQRLRRSLRADSVATAATVVRALPWKRLVRSAMRGDRIVCVRAKPQHIDPFTAPAPGRP